MSQVILFFTSLVITKFYSPDDLGLLGSLGALISIIAGTLCLRLDIAIIQAHKEDSTDVFLKSTLLGGILCTVAVTILYLSDFQFSANISKNFLLFLLWCWGYCLFFNSKQLPFKHNDLSYAAFGGIWRNSFTLIFQFTLGILSPSFNNLLLGRVSGDFVGAVPHIWKYSKTFSAKSLYQNWFRFLKKHKDFIFYTAPHHLCLALSNNLIIFFIENKFNLAIVGFFTLSQRLIQAPLELIGSTFQNVTTQRFGELKEKSKELKIFYQKVLLLSFSTSILIGFIIWLTADYLNIILGNEWAGTSNIVKSLIPFFICTVFNSPTIFILRFINKAKIQLLIELFELSIKIIFLTIINWKNAEMMILSYGVLNLILSLGKSLFVIKFLSK